MAAPYKIGLEFILQALNEERDLAIWQMWLSLYPHFTKDTFISFNNYKSRLIAQEKTHKQTDDEMESMCKMLNAAFGGTVVEK